MRLPDRLVARPAPDQKADPKTDPKGSAMPRRPT
jgi:hypothetical protein